MSSTDTVSVVIAITAAGVALLIAPVVVIRFRSGRLVDPAAERIRVAVRDAAVSVRLIESADRSRIWRLATPADAATTSVEIFTFRPHGGAGHWRHELMEAPLLLKPAAPHDVAAPPATAGSAFDVAIGWTAAGVQASRFLTVHADSS
jgi:hypothetical protein